MEAHRGRALILLLMCVSVPSLAQSQEQKKCPHGDYRTEDGICCNKCPPGFKFVAECRASGQRTNCTSCSKGEYSDEMNHFPNCKSCRHCRALRNEIEVVSCTMYQNTICRCKEDYFKYDIDSGTYECLRCSQCGPTEKTKQICTPEKDTVCECKENYYRVKRKCEPCQNCTVPECREHCSSRPVVEKTKDPPEDPHIETNFHINIIATVGAVALVLVALVFLVTYFTTKQFTTKKLLKSPSSQSSFSPDSFQILIKDEKPSDSHVDKPVYFVSEQEASNLPDCVPLEIKISDLIYTVLDKVPVSKMKQLVRFLGVKDTEIEQAEMDHRSCQEAHYQMLRVWAERGSRAGGGGRGVLHLSLMEELLGQLRKMHLGQAAEELETMYLSQ